MVPVSRHVTNTHYVYSRASVIRGRVVGIAGTGLIGIRVGITSDPLYGFTLTRESGWFDLMVNGGGAAKLQFQREPFQLTERVVTVPWNEIVVMDPVVLVLKDQEPPELPRPYPIGEMCLDHDYELMRPVVLPTWKHGFQGGCPDKSAVLVESQVVQESLAVPGSDFHLVYHSSRASGYLSTIQLQLTPEGSVPASLRRVHLRISIEGILFTRAFEADPAIRFTYAWNRRNVYRQKVYGVTPATVHVGYEYSNCPQIIWEVQTTQVSGHDMSISEIGGWNVAIHHRYNFHEGILQKGDGSNIYLKHKPKMLVTTLGDGNQRSLHCGAACDGPAKSQQLLAPVALASAPDGSIFVGDFNLVRRVTPQGVVSTVVELSAAQVAYRYRLAVGPMDGRLYISDPERHQILAVKHLADIPDVRDNIEPVVGSGAKCLPGDKLMCGDGRPAREARLAYPKGIAVSASNEIYIADGTNIRMVDRQGVIRTIVGDYYHKSHWKPMPCAKTITLAQANLRWPTELALNPLDGSLHILDDHMVLKLTQDSRLKMVAGRPLQCPSPPASREKSDLATDVYLDSPQSIAFAPNGDLYIAESDSQMVNWVRVVSSDGRISKFAGTESKCSCLEPDCKCFFEDHYLAATAKFSTIASITVTPDGLLHICDQGNLRIRSVIAPLPKPNEINEYEIHSPETQDVYVFNRHGQHISTKNVITGKAIYTFSYNVNTSFGKLSTVTDAEGNKIYILRDYSNQVSTIENTQGGKCRLEMSRMRMLQSFTTPSNFKTTYDYHGISGLLRSKMDSTGRSYMHDYDEYGRLIQSVLPSGQTVRLRYNLSVKGASITVTRDDKDPVTLMIKGYGVTTKIGLAEDRTLQAPDGSLTLAGHDGSLVEINTVANPLIADPVLGETFPLPTRVRTTYSEELATRAEWRYLVRRDDKGRYLTQVSRKLKLNGEGVLAVELDREKRTETLLDRNQIPLVTVWRDTQGRALRWVPAQNLTGVTLEYDRLGKPLRWERGPLSLRMHYDSQGRLAEVRHPDDTGVIYKYEDPAEMPAEILLPGGSRYLLQYDQAGNLQAVITPNGHKHEVATQTSLGFYKLLYLSPGVRHPYVAHFDDQGRVLARLYPQNLGRVVYVYNSEGRLQNILCGEERTDYFYHEHTSLIRNVAVSSPKLEFRVDYRYQGVLLKEERLRYNSRSGMDGAKYKFKLDGRQLAVETEINGKTVLEIKYLYNGESGVLEQVNQFLIHRPKINSVFLQDDMRHYSKTIAFDMLGRITVLAMTLWNKEVFSLSLTYDVRNRVQRAVMKIGRDSTLAATNYTYNVDSFIQEVSGPQSWKFSYDVNGNMKSIIDNSQQMSLRYDDGDRLIGYGDVELYRVDGRGFIVQRGEEKFRFNAKAQLIHAFELHQYEVFFYYDVMERLMAKKDHRGNITQFFYANPKEPYQLTHVHYPKDGITFMLLYDTNGHLIYMQEGSNKYYVASDYLGTPLAVFNADGKMIKHISRAPFGKVLHDSNPEFYVPIDFREGIRDTITQLIFYKGRAYDPLSSQWLTPNWEAIPELLMKPYNIHLYRFNGNNPINANVDAYNYLTDFPSWLSALGYESTQEKLLPGAPPSLAANNLPKKDVRMSANQESIPVISGLTCSTELMKNEFTRFSTVAQHNKPIMDSIFPTINHKLANLMSVLGDGILISTFQQKAVVHVVSDASPILRDVIASVFNDTFVVDLHYSLHGQDSFFFVQEDRSKAQGDWDQIQRLGTMFNVTMHAVDTSDVLSRSGQMDLRIHSTSVVLNIRYGSTLAEEKLRLLRHVRRRAVEEAWIQEQDLVRNGHHGSHEWTKSERDELLSTGSVSRYSGIAIHDVERYPHLVDDPTNVLFKKENSRKRRGHSRRPKR
ncbi:TENM2 [Cordylochernes scorpioides]|uniref:TENM2 n=1 Tax=Cordylochernes scorpioides TaxID=51811 RepID=A0ABY6K4A4_9ARAC|nr:TENM2 [Cordylochernes scorpioides]